MKNALFHVLFSYGKRKQMQNAKLLKRNLTLGMQKVSSKLSRKEQMLLFLLHQNGCFFNTIMILLIR
jgi:hypothetical protein